MTEPVQETAMTAVEDALYDLASHIFDGDDAVIDRLAILEIHVTALRQTLSVAP